MKEFLMLWLKAIQIGGLICLFFAAIIGTIALFLSYWVLGLVLLFFEVTAAFALVAWTETL